MIQRWVGVSLAAVSVVQLLVAEFMSKKTGEFGKSYFDNLVSQDPDNELGLPTEPELQKQLKDEMYGAAELAAGGSTVLAVSVAALVGLIVTCVIAVQAKEHAAAWGTAAASVVLAFLAVSLLVQLFQVKLSRYAIGKPVGRWMKTKNEEPSWWRRWRNNVSAAVVGYLQRVATLHTLSAYKTAIIAAAILSAVIGILI